MEKTTMNFGPVMAKSRFELHSVQITDSVKFKYNSGTEWSSDWLYYLRSLRCENRKLGWYLNDSCQRKLLVSFRNNTFYLMLDDEDFDLIYLMLFIEYLISEYKVSVILKKASEYVQNYFRHSKCNYYKLYAGVDLEDETTSEKVLNLEDILKLNNGKVQSISKRFRQGVNRFMNLNLMVVEKEVDPVSAGKILSKLTLDNMDKHKTYSLMSKHAVKFPGYTHRVFYVKHGYKLEPIGFYISKQISPERANLYCAITSKKYGGVTEYCDFKYFSNLWLKGVKYLNIGGAENDGIDKYIGKLLPQTTESQHIAIIFK